MDNLDAAQKLLELIGNEIHRKDEITAATDSAIVMVLIDIAESLRKIARRDFND